jgi:hypothetical protein
MNYTLEEVKEAFWKTFKGAGELWFSYVVTEADESVDYRWQEFLKNLKKDKKDEPV